MNSSHAHRNIALSQSKRLRHASFAAALAGAMLALQPLSNAAAETTVRTGTWGFGLKTIVGSGTSASEKRTIGAFTKIDLQDGLTAEVRRGDAVSVTVTADDNLIALVETKLRENTLVGRIKPNSSLRTRSPLKVVITTPTLEALRVQDGVNATVDRVAAKRAEVRVSDGASLDLATVEGADEIDLVVADGARLTVGMITSGPLQRLRVSDGAKLEIRSNKLNARAVAKLSDGARLVMKDAALSDFDLKASDGSNATVNGRAATQVFLLQDGASVDTRELAGESVSVVASDASAATLGRVARIEVAVGDVARVRHAPDAVVNVKKGRKSQVTAY